VKAARADVAHDKTKRKEVSFGPPRPPPRGQQQQQQQQELEDEAQPSGRAAAGGSGGGGAFGPPRPPGNQQQRAAEGADGDAGLVGPPRPPLSGSRGEGGGGGGSDASDASDDDDEEEADPYRLPISNEVVLSGAERAVTCLDVEHTGSRVAAGSVDNVVRLYDFNGMRSDLKPFRWAGGLRFRL
jgi:hypothetical protein